MTSYPDYSDRSTMSALIVSFVICLVLMLICLNPTTKTAHAGENLWTWTGVSGTVMQIVTDPLNPSTVYARVGSSYENTYQIMKSTDGGTTWSNIASPSWTQPSKTAQVHKIAMASNIPNVLYAATSFGLYRTDNGGGTWQLINSDTGVQSVAVSPADWREAYLSTYLPTGTNTATNIISKTIDGGQTWIDSSRGLPAYPPIDDIAIAPSAPHVLIAKPFNMATGPLYKSTNGGQSWSPIGSSTLIAPNAVTFDPKNSNIIYLGTFSPGGWKSTDGGANWQPIANGLQQNGGAFVIDPDNTQVIHAANLAAGVVESLDGGASWAPINTGIQGLEVRSVAIASRQPLVVYVGLSNAGIWKMTRTNIQDYSITINNADLFTNQTAVTLTLMAPPETTEMLISNDGGFGGVTWEPFTTSKPWAITSLGIAVIPRTVYVKFKTGGRTSGLYQDDIILDTTPPSGSVTLSAPVSTLTVTGPAYPTAPMRHSTTALTYTNYLPLVITPKQIELRLSATDDVSGVDAMVISDRADFAHASWEVFTLKKSWLLAANDARTFYVRFRDRAGNLSSVATATYLP